MLTGSGYLAKTFAHQDRVIAGAGLELAAAFSGAAIAISLYPVLVRHHPGLALGSVGFRLIEAVLYVVAAVGALLLVTLSQQAASARAPLAPHFSTTGALLRALRDQAGLAGVLAFYTGALMQPLYAGLFKGLSETEIDQLLSSFSAAQCVPNQGLVGVLSKYAALPA